MTRPGRVLALALLLILAGGLLAWLVQTAGGSVSVRDIRWVTPDGTRMSALLYVPRGATREAPAPGVVAVHGYINSRETQDGFAIEFARRGYVVLAIDQTGHGYSDPPAFAGGFGGPAALAYLRSLDFVDGGNIGLEGHSMGGWAAGMAAGAAPGDYRSIVLVGSSTGTFGVPQGTPEWPRNLAVVFPRWDEFAPTMWGTPAAADVGETEKMRALFGTAEPVATGRVYGSIADGTARILHQPRTNHPGAHISRAAIGHATDWFQATLTGGTPRPASDQTWYWKEAGNFLGAVGMVLLLFPAGALLLRTPFFAELNRAPAPARPARGTGWWIAAAMTALLGPVTFLRFKSIPEAVGWSAGALLPQSLTNGIVAWTTALAALSLVLLAGWHLAVNRREGATTESYGLRDAGGSTPRLIAKSFLLALLVVAAGYLALIATSLLFTTDFRLWVFAIKPLSLLHLRMALAYLPFFTFFFLALAIVLHGQLRRDAWSGRTALGVNATILVGGWIVFHLYQYVPLFTRGTLAIPSEPLWTIVAYQLVPLMAIVAGLLTFFGRRTGSVYAGGFAAALLVTWIVVASQATHVPI